MVTSYRESRTDAQVLEQGIATYVTAASVSDANKQWAANQWRGYLVRFRSGNGAPNDHAVGVIASNDGTSFTLEASLRLSSEATLNMTYEILAIKGGDSETRDLATLQSTLEGILNVLVQIRDDRRNPH